MLAQQLLAAGEHVLDVQPKLGARVRLLSSGTPDKNDPNDARSVAVAALRSPVCHQVRADDHAVVLRVWSRRHRQLSRLRTQAACRLHAVLCDLTPGGVPKVITAARAAAILDAHHPAGPVGQAWHDLAAEHLADLRRIDTKLRDARAKITAAVRASGTTLAEIFGVGPVIAAAVIGDVADVSRFPGADRFASYNGTAPIEVSSGSRKIYRLSIGDGTLILPPVVAGGCLYAASSAGNVYAVAPSSGQQVWTDNVGTSVTGGPETGMAIGGGLLVVPAGSTLTAFGNTYTAVTRPVRASQPH